MKRNDLRNWVKRVAPRSLLALGRRARTFWMTRVVRDEHSIAYESWLRDDADRRLRFNYPLSARSTVLDCGGYHGDFAGEIVTRYGSRVFVFEPVASYHASCALRFRDDPRVTCLNYGVSSFDGEVAITDEEDGSSVIKAAGEGERVRVRALSEVLREQHVDEVDLIKINIEGGEYQLLEHMIEAGLVLRFRFIQVQFHDFVPDARALRTALRERLRQTHMESWCYPFVWESWERKA